MFQRLQRWVERNPAIVTIIVVAAAVLQIFLLVVAEFGQGPLVYAVWGILILSALGLAAVLIEQRRWPQLAVLVVIVLLVIALPTVIALAQPDPSVSISSLSDGDRIRVVIDSQTDDKILGHHVVSGSSSGLDPAQDVYLLAADATKDQWWLYETVRMSNGAWEGHICYGIAEVGKPSYLVAIAANRSRARNLPLVEGQQVVTDPKELSPVAESKTVAISIGELVQNDAVNPTHRCVDPS